jgi:hypothetical protein
MLRSIFRLGRSASDMEPFLVTMTRLAENPVLQRICNVVHQTFLVGFGSLGARVSVACRTSFAQLLLHSSLIKLKLFECEVQYDSPQESLLSTITIITTVIMIIFLFTIIPSLLNRKGLLNLAYFNRTTRNRLLADSCIYLVQIYTKRGFHQLRRIGCY